MPVRSALKRRPATLLRSLSRVLCRARTLSSFRAAGALLALIAAAGLSGCGPFGYIGKVSQKSVDAVQKAEDAEAETYAPYEYWAAKTYLDRARVMMSYSEYERAFDYGSRAQQLAEAAARKAERVKAQEAKKSAGPSLPAPESTGQVPGQGTGQVPGQTRRPAQKPVQAQGGPR